MAFDLVAKLKLQDDFTSRLKKVGQQLDRMKNQVKKASSTTEDMGKKFSKASTVASTGLDKIKNNASKMQNIVGKAGSFSAKSLNVITKSAKDVGSKFSDLGSRSRDALSRIGNSASQLPGKFSGMGSKIKSSISGGIRAPALNAKNAIMGIASAVGVVAIASKGFNMLKGAIEGAVSRYDTLNNFPRVMEAMGFSASESKKSIDRLAEGIDGLPTALDEIASTAQRIATSSGDLSKATETAIALNNALLASGSDAEKASRGTEQYLKALSTGKMELDSWTTLQETMGLGLNEVAKAFGITGEQLQNQLYDKLKSGDITMDDFNKKLIELSETTGGFGDKAKDATGGLATAWGNMKIAVAKGVTGTIEKIDEALGGTGKIADIIMLMKDKVNESFVSINKRVLSFVKALKKVYDATKPIHPILIEVAKAALIFGTVLGGMALAAGAIAGIGAIFAVIGSGVGIAILAIAGLATGFALAYKHIEPFRQGVDKLIGGVKALFKAFGGDKDGAADLAKKMGFSDDQIQLMLDFTEKVKGVFEGIKLKATEFGEFLSEKWKELAPAFETLVEAFALAKENAVNVFQTLWDVLQPIFGALQTAFMIVADIAVIAWTNIIAPAIKFTMKIFQTLWAIVGPLLKLLGSAIGVAFEILKIVWNTIIKPVTKFLTNQFKQALEDLSPVLDGVKGAFDIVGGAIEKVAGWFDSFKTALSRFKVPNWLSKLGGGGTVKFEGGDVGGGEPGHYHGIKYVPRDNYAMRAHKGERVLTAKENKEYSKGDKSASVMVTGNTFHVRKESDVDAIADKIVRKFIAAGEGGA